MSILRDLRFLGCLTAMSPKISLKLGAFPRLRPPGRAASSAPDLRCPPRNASSKPLGYDPNFESRQAPPNRQRRGPARQGNCSGLTDEFSCPASSVWASSGTSPLPPRDGRHHEEDQR